MKLTLADLAKHIQDEIDKARLQEMLTKRQKQKERSLKQKDDRTEKEDEDLEDLEHQ